MTIQARLTLWSVIVMVVLVACISAIDLKNEMQRQFDSNLERADLLMKFSVRFVLRSLERDPSLPIGDALSKDPKLSTELVDVLTASPSLVEIAVCDPNNQILASSDPSRIGQKFMPYADFGRLVKNTGWIEKVKLLFGDRNYYQISEALGAEEEKEPSLYVRLVIYPWLIRDELAPALKKNAGIALASVIGAVVVAIAFSTIAFRPLGRLGQMLDSMARGEYEPAPAPQAQERPVDEFGVVASKVNLLGQQLRGARYDFSDLRGNFERLLDELEDAVLIFGRDRRLVVASGAVEKFLGKMRSDLIGRPLTEIFPPTTTLGLLLAQAAQTGRPIRNRRVPLTGEGQNVSVALLSIDLLESFNAGPDAGRGTGLMMRLRDPEPTRQIGRQLQTAERLSAISRITGGVAHEVKNPLNAILMHVELARMKLARGAHDLSDHMDIITKEILRLDRVVKTFLDFTRPVQLNLAEAPLEIFVSDIVELATPQAVAKGIEVTVNQQADGVMINADLDLLKQAILNIVVNAIEVMQGGGQLRFESTVQGDEAEIRISDTGPGIPPDLRDKIFRLYFTTKESGSGIGLAMAFRIVQLHDGTIDFSSEPGKGTTFVLRIPTAV